MTRQPRGDNLVGNSSSSRSSVGDPATRSGSTGGTVYWDGVLAHRSESDRAAVVERFELAGVTPDAVASVLADAGDDLYAAAASGDPDWAEPFGGPLVVALLAAEVSALMAHLTSRASAVRGLAVDALLEDVSAVSVANRLGVSRQKVYTIARGALERPYLDQVPWREP